MLKSVVAGCGLRCS